MISLCFDLNPKTRWRSYFETTERLQSEAAGLQNAILKLTGRFPDYNCSRRVECIWRILGAFASERHLCSLSSRPTSTYRQSFHGPGPRRQRVGECQPDSPNGKHGYTIDPDGLAKLGWIMGVFLFCKLTTQLLFGLILGRYQASRLPF